MEHGLQKYTKLLKAITAILGRWQDVAGSKGFPQPKVSLQQFWFEQSTSWPANYRPAVTSSCCCRLFELLTVKAVCAEEKHHSNHICEHIIFLHFIDIYWGNTEAPLHPAPWGGGLCPFGWCRLDAKLSRLRTHGNDSTCHKSKLKPGTGCHYRLLCPGTALIGWSWLTGHDFEGHVTMNVQHRQD